MNKFDAGHYWEIGKAGYPLSKIVNEIQKAGFKIEKTYRIFQNPYIKKGRIELCQKKIQLLA